MTIQYHSTRNQDIRTTPSLAILQGIAPDGGLYVPDSLPNLPFSLEAIPQMDYHQLAFSILKSFFSDFSDEELHQCVRAAYDEKFDRPDIAALRQAGDMHYLELFHGPTLAFKDMALSILPHLMTTAAKKNGLEKEIVILTATSGDTGKAALVGFKDVPGTRIIVFYPKDGVSEIQERQMLTQKGENVSVVAIDGNFDDAQSRVKALFADTALREQLEQAGMQFSSANSINIGRLVPQIVYYLYAYGQLLGNGTLQAGEEMNVCVPTGNFGNILAAYYAKEMGLPIRKLLVASNRNHVLTEFFQSGEYDRNRPFHLTASPSMDILVSSNLERFLHLVSDDDTQTVRQLMRSLATEGNYSIPSKWRDNMEAFWAAYADDDATKQQIAKVYQESGYLIDPHTAVASSVADRYREQTGDKTPMVVASTASPLKFPLAVLEAIEPAIAAKDTVQALLQLQDKLNLQFPAAIEEALHGDVLHDTMIATDQMKATIQKALGIPSA